MAELISHPFRLGLTGAVVVLNEDSTDYYGEILGVMVATVPGERVQVPLFGINDPTFGTIDPHELNAKLSLFGPPVTIKALTITTISETEQDVQVEFDVIQGV